MNAFLFSSMNMELVCAILQGVKQSLNLTMIENKELKQNNKRKLTIKDFKAE